MPPMRFSHSKFSLVSLSFVVSLGLYGCSTIQNLNPLKAPERDDKATQGERISITAYEQKLTPSESLAGIDFYLPPAVHIEQWTQASGPMGAALEHVDAAKDFKVAWSRSIGAGTKPEAAVVARPVSDGNLIYTLDGGARVCAFNVDTGAQSWCRDLNPHKKRDKWAFGGGLALYGEQLYVTTGYRELYALTAATGKPIWDKAIDAPVHQAPITTEKFVIISDVDNHVLALDRLTGEPDWNYQAIIEPARLLKSAGGTLVDNVLFAPFSSGEVAALDVNSGAVLWSEALTSANRVNALSEIRDIAGNPVIFKDVVFAASHSGAFAAMSASTGARLWSIGLDSVNTPWVAGDVVYLVTTQGELMAISRESGQIYWISNLNEGLVKVKKAKDREFEVKAPKNIPTWTGPILASDRLIVTNSLGDAVALDPKTGKKISKLKLGGASYIAAIAVKDKLFIVTDDAKLVALR